MSDVLSQEDLRAAMALVEEGRPELLPKSDIHRVDDFGNTLLHLLAEIGSQHVTWLVENDANTNSRNQDGLTPEDVARLHGHEGIANFLSVGCEWKVSKEIVQGADDKVKMFSDQGDGANALKTLQDLAHDIEALLTYTGENGQQRLPWEPSTQINTQEMSSECLERAN